MFLGSPIQERKWSIGLCECFTDISATLCSLFFFPCYLFYTYDKVNEGFCSCLCGGLEHLRTKVRTERGIEVKFIFKLGNLFLFN